MLISVTSFHYRLQWQCQMKLSAGQGQLYFLNNNTSFIVLLSSIIWFQSWCQDKALQNCNSYLERQIASRVEQSLNIEVQKSKQDQYSSSDSWNKIRPVNACESKYFAACTSTACLTMNHKRSRSVKCVHVYVRV